MGNVDSNSGVGRGVDVVDTQIAIVIYLGGWIVATLAMYAASERWNDRQSPAPHTLWVSVIAGAVWPLLLVGMVEMTSVVVYTKVQSKPDPGVGIFA